MKNLKCKLGQNSVKKWSENEQKLRRIVIRN
jgi:hypothetical protein